MKTYDQRPEPYIPNFDKVVNTFIKDLTPEEIDMLVNYLEIESDLTVESSLIDAGNKFEQIVGHDRYVELKKLYFRKLPALSLV